MKKILISLFTILFSLTALATDYYVTTAGNSGNNGLSEGSAWDIEHAFATAGPGDVVYIKAGNYQGAAGNQIQCSTFGASDGTALNPVKFIGYTSTPGDIVATTGPTFDIADWDANGNDFDESVYPVIRWVSEVGDGGWVVPDNNIDGIDIWTDYVEISNIQIRGFAVNVVLSARNTTLNNVHSGRSGNWDSSHPDYNASFSADINFNRGYGFSFVSSRDCYYATLKNCISIDEGMDSFLMVGANPTTPNSTNTYHLLENCYAYYDDIGNGTDYMFNLISVNYNTIRNCKAMRLPATTSGHGSRGIVIKYGANNNLVENFESFGTKNQLHSEAHDNTIDGMTMTGQLSDFQLMYANDNIIRNLKVDYQGGTSSSGAIAFMGWTGSEYGYACTSQGSGTGNVFINPILLNGGAGISAISFDRQNYDPAWPAAGTNTIIGGTIDNFDHLLNVNRGGTLNFYNTIVSNVNNYDTFSTATVASCWGSGSAQDKRSELIRNFTNTSFDNSTNGFTNPVGSLNLAPLYVGGGDYSLQSGSDLIGAGMDGSTINSNAGVDFNGNSRSVPYDIGVYESGSTPPVTGSSKRGRLQNGVELSNGTIYIGN